MKLIIHEILEGSYMEKTERLSILDDIIKMNTVNDNEKLTIIGMIQSYAEN